MKVNKKVKTIFKILSLLSITFSVIVIFYIFNLGKTPLKMNEYTLSNGEKTIIFQEMVHIGETSYYETINEKLLDYRNKGFKFAYEQVNIKSNEETEELKELTGITVDIYGKIGNVLALDSQKSHMNMILEEDLNADVTGAELISLLKTHKEKNKKEGKKEETEDIGESLRFIENLGNLSDYQKNIVKLMFRAILKVAGDNSEMFMEEGTYIQKVILESRDQALFDKVKKLNADKLVIHYGKFHYKGFFDRLQKEDSNWKIKKVEEIVAF
jgi:hypothetical protein